MRQGDEPGSLGVDSTTVDVYIDALVQQVRKRLHGTIQRLHGAIPSWGVDYWIPLGKLYVDVNILEVVTSGRRLDLDDLWRDFISSPNYRSLDRIGLGKGQKRVPGLEVLSRRNNLVVLGKPGSGKTTFLQRIVTACNGGELQQHRIPTLIKLREFVDDGLPFKHSLKRYLSHCWAVDESATESILRAGRALVLVDGLDEVTGENGREISRQLKTFSRTYPDNQLIVTCRTQSHDWRFDRFDYVEIADFNESQAREFARHWFQAVQREEDVDLSAGDEFLHQLFAPENTAIRELCITPILLSLTCAVFCKRGTFYSRRAKLYEEGLGILLERWDKLREVDRSSAYRDLSLERKIQLLGHLALKKLEQPQYVLFEQSELESLIADFLGISTGEARSVLRAVEAQHGLLIERAQGVWSFSHLTFQEYLAARWLSDKQDWPRLMNHAPQSHWREVFLLLADSTNQADLLLNFIKKWVDDQLSDDTCQAFLTWVHTRSLSIAKIYVPCAARAFHFGLVVDLTFRLANKLDAKFEENLDFDTDYAYSRAGVFATHPMAAFQVQLYFVLSRCYQLSGIQDRLPNAHGSEPSLTRLRLDIALAISHVGKLLNYPQVRQIAIRVDDLRRMLPPQLEIDGDNMSDSEREWWTATGKAWTTQLECAMADCYDMWRDWRFDTQQIVQLCQYNIGNQLLADCLQHGAAVSSAVKEDILKGLLLPIAQKDDNEHR